MYFFRLTIFLAHANLNNFGDQIAFFSGRVSERKIAPPLAQQVENAGLDQIAQFQDLQFPESAASFPQFQQQGNYQELVFEPLHNPPLQLEQQGNVQEPDFETLNAQFPQFQQQNSTQELGFGVLNHPLPQLQQNNLQEFDFETLNAPLPQFQSQSLTSDSDFASFRVQDFNQEVFIRLCDSADSEILLQQGTGADDGSRNGH